MVRPYILNGGNIRNGASNRMPESRGASSTTRMDSFLASSEEHDCGFKCLFKNIKCRKFQKYATINRFFATLCVLVLLQAAVQEVFTGTVITRNSYNLSPKITSWLITWEGCIQVMFAVLIAYVGTNRHRPSWIATFCFLQAVMCFVLTLYTTTTLYYTTKNATQEIHSDLSLCAYGKYRDTHPRWYWNTTLMVLLFAFQTMSTITYISLVTLGIVYLDDNIQSVKMPIFIGIVVATKYVGIQISRFIMWFKNESDLYTSDDVMWYCFGAMLFGLSVVIALFPYRYTESTVSTLPANNGVIRRSLYRRESPGIFKNVKRILSNRTALFTILAIASIQTVIANGAFIESDYFKSVFFIDDYSSTDLINITRLPVVCLCIIATGYILFALRPKASRIIAANVIILCFIIAFFSFGMFLRCNELYLHNEVIKRRTLLEQCNQDCQCLTSQKFSPVCAERSNAVYYSPCHAGCREAYINTEFWKCGCVPTSTVSAAYCKNDSCSFSASIFRLIVLFSILCVASTIVGNILLLMRLVEKENRSLVIGIQFTVSAIFIHVPGKLLYSIIQYSTCSLLENDGCRMNNSVHFSTYIGLLNICFVMTACGLFSLAWYSIRGVNMFPKTESNGQQEMQELYFQNPNSVHENRNLLSRRSNSTGAIPLSDSNPFKDDVIKEFTEMQQKYSTKSELDLYAALRQNQFNGGGVTIRKNGILTTIL